MVTNLISFNEVLSLLFLLILLLLQITLQSAGLSLQLILLLVAIKTTYSTDFHLGTYCLPYGLFKKKSATLANIHIFKI